MITELSSMIEMLNNMEINYKVFKMGTSTEVVLDNDITLIFTNDTLNYIKDNRNW